MKSNESNAEKLIAEVDARNKEQTLQPSMWCMFPVRNEPLISGSWKNQDGLIVGIEG